MYGNKNTDFFQFSNTNDKWSVAFFQSNDKTEELANARNGFGHDNNEGKNIDDQKHCKTLSGLSMDSNESSRKKKSHVISRRIKNVSRANWKNVKHLKAQTTNKKACQKVKRPRRRMETTFKKF